MPLHQQKKRAHLAIKAMSALTVIFFLIMLATAFTDEVKFLKKSNHLEKNVKMPEKVGEDEPEEDLSATNEDLSGSDLLAELGDHGGSNEEDEGGELDDTDLDDLSGNAGLDDLDVEDEDFASMPLHKIRLLHKAVDADGDNRTSLGELLQFSDNVHNETIKQIVPELLDMLDHIKDGKLSLDEILEDVVDDSSDLSPDEINTWKELETMKFKLA